MSRNTKIVLGIAAAVVVVLCLCAAASVFVATVLFRNISVTSSPGQVETGLGEAILINPSDVTPSTQAIAGLALPDGWRSDYSMNVAGFRLIGYKPVVGSGHIIVAVVPETSGASLDELQAEIQNLTDRGGYKWNRSNMTVVERKPVTIHGQTSEMVISEGSGSSGTWRQAMVSFRDEQGLTLVIFGVPKDSYDQEQVDALFASIR